MSIFICPICKSPLVKNEKSYVCPNRHTFDVAREGYVNLLPSGKANSAIPGDGKEMVASRTRLLESGAYADFAAALSDIVRDYGVKSPVILDAGCGQGYYDRAVKDKNECELYGIDISKFAVKYASSHNKDMSYAVAGVYDMPILDGSVDVLMSVFSPIAQDEFCRVVKSGGIAVIAVPGPRHLFGLKEILYERPYENEVVSTEYDGFCFTDRIAVTSSLTLTDSDLIESLFAMTPYYWKTGVEGHERLKNTSRLETEIHFDFLIYKKY